MTSRALSIRQPWAWAILHAGKDIENRKWRTQYRGRFFIHASKTVDIEALEYLRSQGYQVPGIEQLPTGGIVGSAEIVDCVQQTDSVWFSGPYGFVLRKPCVLPLYPMRGHLNFFKVNQQKSNQLHEGRYD